MLTNTRYADCLEEKILFSRKFLADNLDKHSVVLWSGGKDSNAALRLALDVDPDINVLYEETGGEFDEAIPYLREIVKLWNIKNFDIIRSNRSPWELPRWAPAGMNLCTYWLKVIPSIDYLVQKNIKTRVFGDRALESADRMKRLEEKGLIQEGSLLGEINPALKDLKSLYPLANWSEEDVLRLGIERNYPQNPMQDQLGSTLCTFCPYHDFLKLQKKFPEVYDQLLKKTSAKTPEELKERLFKIFVETENQ